MNKMSHLQVSSHVCPGPNQGQIFITKTNEAKLLHPVTSLLSNLCTDGTCSFKTRP